MSFVSRTFSACDHSSSARTATVRRAASANVMSAWIGTGAALAMGYAASWSRVSSSRMTPSRSPPRPMLQRRAEDAARLLEDQHARGEQPHALGVELEAAGDVGRRRAREDAQAALEGVGVEDRADEPAQRPGAAADGVGDRGAGRVEPLEGARDVLADLLQLRGGGRVGAQVGLGEEARADAEGRAPRDPVGERADDELGGAAADVDDADLAERQVAERAGRAGEGEPRLLLAAEDLDVDAGLRARWRRAARRG